MQKLKVIVIGAGSRGIGYSEIMSQNRDKFEVVAVAEPIKSRREHIRELYGLPDEMCFSDYTPLLAMGKIADLAVIATMDRDHFAPAMKAIELGYDLLLEKPIAPTMQECAEITKAADKHQVRIVICTVLRYTPLFGTLKYLIDTGRIGKVISINHEECVGNVHQSHSFVRGNWGNEDRSSAMLLQKSCHDLDILQWLIGKRCKRIHSFGTLTYFRRENAPEGSPEYCVQGCPHSASCPYNAVKLYVEDRENRWFRTTATKEYAPSDDDVLRAVTHTQYGKCVFKCDNTVVDHQTVNMLFDDDITVTFTMNAFNKGGRYIHIMGTEGEIHASLDASASVSLYDFQTKTTEEIPCTGTEGIVSGHGGGDQGLLSTLYDYLLGRYEGCSIPTIAESFYNHVLVFAAEQSRLTNTVVDVEEFIKGCQ